MKTSESSPLMSFSSLPDDIVLNCLARVSRVYYPTLSLVCKSFQSLLSSRELYVTRTLIRKTEDILYVCLNLNKYKPEPRWFALSPTPKQQKLIPMPSFPYTENSTVLSTGSEIYIIGGFSNGERSKRVFCLDYQSHKWRRLPDMYVARKHPAADVIDGNIHVIGGYTGPNILGEVYNTKTQTWEPLAQTTLDLTIRESVYRDRFVMGGQIRTKLGGKIYPRASYCLVKLGNKLYNIFIRNGVLHWYGLKKGSGYAIMGLEELSSNHLVAVANPSGGSRVTVWWKKERESDRCYSDYHTNIWCAEILFKRVRYTENWYGITTKLWGSVEWSKQVFYYDGDSDLFLDSATTMPY